MLTINKLILSFITFEQLVCQIHNFGDVKIQCLPFILKIWCDHGVTRIPYAHDTLQTLLFLYVMIQCVNIYFKNMVLLESTMLMTETLLF